ncbi:phage terminase large subunit, partial [Inquilinus sp. Marseille-Q2685]|uniref:phage terminase large subunit n=1 Tax=Inquilinus sp. Marseille-Q2685 TaxID=2866581 RepID=UPI001CE42BC5
MEEDVAWAVEVQADERLFAQRFVQHGNASLAAAEVGYAEANVRARGTRLLARAEILVACFEEVELRRRKGIPPVPAVRRKLTRAAARVLSRGAVTRRSIAATPSLEQAFGEFRHHHGIDSWRWGGGAAPSPSQGRARSEGPLLGEREGPGGDAGGRVRGIAPPAPMPVPPPLRLPRKFKRLAKPSRYKALHGGRGSGKSHVFAELLVRRCFETPTRAVCIREVQRSLDQSVKRLLEDKIQALGLGAA